MNLGDMRQEGRPLSIRFFQLFSAAVTTVILLSGCSKAPESAPVPASVASPDKINISGSPELSKLKREYVRTAPYEEKKTIDGTMNLKDSYASVLFPFPFTVVESYVKTGDRVRKGDRLFLIESAALEQAITGYQKNRDQALAKSLRDIGLDPDSAVADSRLVITAPAGGTVAAVAGGGIPAQALAVIQLKKTVILQATAVNVDLTENTRYFIRVNDEDVELTLVTRNDDKNPKLTLSFDSKDGFSMEEKVLIQVVNSIDAFPMNRNAVLNRNGRTFCFVETSDGVLEKRDIAVVQAGDSLLVKDGLKSGEVVINDNVGPIAIKFKI